MAMSRGHVNDPPGAVVGTDPGQGGGAATGLVLRRAAESEDSFSGEVVWQFTTGDGQGGSATTSRGTSSALPTATSMMQLSMPTANRAEVQQRLASRGASPSLMTQPSVGTDGGPGGVVEVFHRSVSCWKGSLEIVSGNTWVGVRRQGQSNGCRISVVAD